MLKSLLAIGALSAQLSAFAMPAPLWTCQLNFDAQGGGVQLIVGSYELRGGGELRCNDVYGNTQILPVGVRIGGSPIALRAAVGQFCVSGVASGVGYATDPSALLGKYQTVGAAAAIGIAGLGADAGTHFKADCGDCRAAATFNFSVQKTCGWGARAGYSTVEIFQ